MSHLLLKLVANPTMNRTIFPARLFVYDDALIFRKRSLIRIRETTIAYSHIVQVNLIRGIFFARLEIINNGVENIDLKFVSKSLASKAKKLIDQKIYFAHAKEKADQPITSITVNDVEKSLNRLKELLSKGVIGQREYEKRRDKYLKRME
ncbi:MAG TPA: hypothetical protein VLI92_00890 [Candidatus Saccharimonadales bacterium]|nr:hypothetical protein [Candidatus Saccharimonadales bacterium]